MYAAKPALYTPLLRGETAADWRETYRKALQKINDKYGFCKQEYLIDGSTFLQEDYDNWLKWREKFGVGMLLNDTSSNRHIIFTALQVSVLIRVRSSLLSGRVLCSFRSTMRARPRRSTARRRSPRTRGGRSSTRS